MAAPPRSIDEYLARLSPEKRATLEKLRKDILAAAPKAEECISYQIPGFRLNGRLLVSFGAATKHCAFYPGAHPLEALAKELAKYATSRGTIRFPVDTPLPTTLVRTIVKLRVAENSGKKPVAKRAAKRIR